MVHLQDRIDIGTSAAFGYVITIPRLPALISQGVPMLLTYDPPFTMWLPQFVD